MEFQVNFLILNKLRCINVKVYNLCFSRKKRSIVSRNTFTHSRSETQHKIRILNGKVPSPIPNETSFTNIIFTQITSKESHDVGHVVFFYEFSKVLTRLREVNTIAR